MKQFNNRFLGIILFSFLFINPIWSQSLPSNRKVNWRQVLSTFVFTYPNQEFNFVTFGGNNNGNVANDAVMTSLLNGIDSSTGATVYFPSGTYLFNSKIVLKSNVVLKGESSGTANLVFDLGGNNNLIEITGTQTSIESSFAQSAQKDDNTITVDDASPFQAGDYLKISDNDIAKVTSDWAIGTTGQIVKIKSISANQITLNSSLRRSYALTDVPKIAKLIPITNAGIDNISITRVDATVSQTSNIEVNNAVNCIFNCIKSTNTNFAHISISNSTNCQVLGSYFKDAFNYGDGGMGYGVALKSTTGECLVYNNIFIHLRHSMLLQSGANGNVLSYNYSNTPYWTEPLLPSNSAGDLTLHGNWPYCNLMEGNIVQNIVIDNSHGLNGPFNTFHRNRAESYGIFMNTSSGGSMNFISNEVVNSGFLLGLYVLTGSNHFEYGNNVKGSIYTAGTTGQTDNSLYLSSPLPYYSTNYFWPPIGLIANYNTNSIESKDRFNANLLTECSSLMMVADNAINRDKNRFLFPNPTKGKLTIYGLTVGDAITIVDVMGRIQSSYNLDSESFSFSTTSLANGIYICIINGVKNDKTHIRFIKSN